jgi:membrane-bound serine protease (ClpP class)
MPAEYHPAMSRILMLLALAAAALTVTAPAIAADAESEGGPVVIADVRGPLEQRAIDFLVDAVSTDDAGLVVIQVNNPGVASGDPQPLFDAIDAATVPVVAWVGPPGAKAYGPLVEVLARVDHTGAAPGASIGYAGEDATGDQVLADTAVEVGTEPIAGLVDSVVPTIGQYIALLDGMTFDTTEGAVVLDVVETTTADDGTETVVAATEVRFLKPGLLTRILRLAVRPEATFFFLVAGLAAASFEFYAAGVGISASIAALSLFLAGFGVASLPMNWPALAAVLLGVVLVTIDFQDAAATWRGLLGTVALLLGGLNLTTAAPLFAPRWWAIVLTVIGYLAFVMVALTTVARSRFSTRTIGRSHLIGKSGVARTGFDPTGIVEVDGAEWKARTHRAAGVRPGDPVEVVAVSGIMLEVGPPAVRE